MFIKSKAVHTIKAAYEATVGPMDVSKKFKKKKPLFGQYHLMKQGRRTFSPTEAE